MQAHDTELAGAKLIKPAVHQDSRGYFKEVYASSKFHEIGIDDTFVQDSVSYSARNVLRGLHCDPQMSKVVSLLSGRVYDVIVDARRHSQTFGKWQGFYLSDDDHREVYVPAGFLHGFLTLTDGVLLCYKHGAEYSAVREIGVRWDDPTLNIQWPGSSQPMLSDRDRHNQFFEEAFPPVL